MEDIGLLVKRLHHTEEERHRASQRLENIIEEAVTEMLEILYELYPTLGKEDIMVRSYSGATFAIGEGIVIYSKGIDEKIVLDREKKLMRYKAKNNDLIQDSMSPNAFLTEIGFQKVYSNIKDIVKEQIKTNNEKTLAYRSQTSKIQRHMAELQNDIRPLKEGI